MVYATGEIMSNYCTNCEWLGKATNTGRTQWLCKKERAVGYMLQSLCGNPTRLLQCINANWYKKKLNMATCRIGLI